MTKDYSKDRWVPKHLNTQIKQNDYFDFYWNNDNDKPLLMGFAKKAKNCLFYYRFKTVEQMNKKINETLDNAKSREEEKAKRKALANKPHTLKVGDILYSSWGYDQTNIDYYKVVKLVGKNSVKIIKVSTATQSTDCVSQDKATPGDIALDKRVIDNAITKKVNGDDNSIKVRSWGVWARPWDGQPKYQTAWGYGH